MYLSSIACRSRSRWLVRLSILSATVLLLSSLSATGYLQAGVTDDMLPSAAIPDRNLKAQADSFAYNMGKGLRRWRSKLAALSAGSAETINLCVIGDSITEGAISNASPANYLTKGYVGLIRAALATEYEDMGTGFIPTHYVKDSLLWTFGGTWIAETASFGVTGACRASSVNGSTATLAFNGTGVGIVVARGSVGGTLDFTIDAAPAGSFDTYKVSPADPAYVHEISGLGAGDHTLVVTANLTAGETIWLLGAYPIKGASGVRVNMCGRWGTTTANAVGSYAPEAEIDIWNPALTIIAYTANDFAGQTALATYTTNLQTLVTRALTYGDVLLVSVGPTNATYPISQTAYVDAMKQVALANNVAFIDIYGRWNGGAYAKVTLGLLADDVHPNAAGHQDIATAILGPILE